MSLIQKIEELKIDFIKEHGREPTTVVVSPDMIDQLISEVQSQMIGHYLKETDQGLYCGRPPSPNFERILGMQVVRTLDPYPQRNTIKVI